MENNLKKIYIKKNIQKSTRIYETSKPSFLIPLNPDKFLKTYSRQNITPLRVIQQNENNKLLKSNRKHNRNISLNNNKINIEKNEKILIKKIPLSQSSKNIYVNHNKDIFANKLEENDEFNKLIESDLKDENNIENSSILNTTNKLFNKNKNNEKNKILSTEKKFNNKKIEHKIKDNKKNDSSKSLKIINFSSNSSSYNTHSYLNLMKDFLLCKIYNY